MSRNFKNAIQSIRQNKLRTVLAGFGIAWGIFLLVIFLGVGRGFRSGVIKLFNGYAQKSLFIYGGQTSVATPKLNEHTQILFQESIIRDMKKRYGAIRACSPEMSLPSVSVSSEGESSAVSVKGVSADYFKIKILDVKNGRALNPLDDRLSRYKVVIGEGVEQALFGKASGLRKKIIIGDALFEVVGILSSEDLFSLQERNSVYLPFPAFKEQFHSTGIIPSFCLSLSQDAETAEIERDVKGYLARQYGFDPHDESALYVANIETQTSAFDSLFHGLEALIWVVGICLLLSGIVGVCNVMLIIVKERTNEIGIRKAVGATQTSIISMMMTESVLITSCAGVVGVVLGIGAVFLADGFLLPLLNTEIMDSLEIDGMAVIASMLVLCISGILAGLFPALKASQIEPVDAIRYENRD